MAPVDPKAVEFFRVEREKDPANGLCADCGTEGADWASVSHGIYLSIGASGVHRSLGVRVSFVQSTTMDSWKPVHLRMMELGGNRRFAEVLRRHGIPEETPLREKYRTRAAAWYRKTLRAEAEGTELPEELEEGTGHLPTEDAYDDRLVAMLDQVFAAAPRCGDMTRGGVPHLRPLAHCRAKSLEPMCYRRRDRGRQPREGAPPKATNFPDWVAKQLDKMTMSKGTRAAEKLKTMSTGSMQGFGPDDVIQLALQRTSDTFGLPKQAAAAA